MPSNIGWTAGVDTGPSRVGEGRDRTRGSHDNSRISYCWPRVHPGDSRTKSSRNQAQSKPLVVNLLRVNTGEGAVRGNGKGRVPIK